MGPFAGKLILANKNLKQAGILTKTIKWGKVSEILHQNCAKIAKVVGIGLFRMEIGEKNLERKITKSMRFMW